MLSLGQQPEQAEGAKTTTEFDLTAMTAARDYWKDAALHLRPSGMHYGDCGIHYLKCRVCMQIADRLEDKPPSSDRRRQKDRRSSPLAHR